VREQCSGVNQLEGVTVLIAGSPNQKAKLTKRKTISTIVVTSREAIETTTKTLKLTIVHGIKTVYFVFPVPSQRGPHLEKRDV
jgi:hypothetical protein